jgi:hypothetical protein
MHAPPRWGAARSLVAWGAGEATIPAMKPHPPGAVASLVCGVLSVMTWWLPLLGAPLAIIALIQGRRAGRVSEPDAFQPPGLATAGQVCGVIGLACALVATLAGLVLIAAVGALVQALPALPAHPAAVPHVPLL